MLFGLVWPLFGNSKYKVPPIQARAMAWGKGSVLTFFPTTDPSPDQSPKAAFRSKDKLPLVSLHCSLKGVTHNLTSSFVLNTVLSSPQLQCNSALEEML